MNVQFAPSDFFVWNGSGIGSVAGGGVRYLAEIAPERHVFDLQVLIQHGHHADGEIARNAAAYLKKPDAALGIF